MYIQFMKHLCLSLFIISAFFHTAVAQTQHSDHVLYQTIRQQDSLLFAAFNNRNVNQMAAYFDKSLELYQDNIGVRNYQETVNAFGELFKKDYVLKRELITSSLEVYPIKGFGAIETGQHQFCHTENGKYECSTFKFVHIWQFKNGQWKITRIVTYDH